MAITKETKYTVSLADSECLEIEQSARSITIYRWESNTIASSIEIEYSAIADLVSVLTEIEQERLA